MIKNTPTKILFLITKSNWGGAQRYVYDLAVNLDREKFTPVVALGGEGKLKSLLEEADVKVIQINSLERNVSLSKEITFAKELWQILKTEQPTVLHVNSSKAGAVGTLLGRLAKIPRVIFTAHGWAFNEDRPLFQKVIIKFIHGFTVLLSHQTITVSNALKAQLDWPFIKNKMVVINPGRDLNNIYEKAAAKNEIVKEQPTLNQYLNEPWVITIAELHPIKRLDVLIEAAALVVAKKPNTRFIIIGEGEEREKLEYKITKLNLSTNVFLVGSILEAGRLLKAADLFVLPSKSESYGYVLHEAGLAGLPVLATDVGGIRDIVEPYVSGKLIPPDDSNALQAEIENFLVHPEPWLEYAQNLQTKMAGRTLTDMVQKTIATYLVSSKSDAS